MAPVCSNSSNSSVYKTLSKNLKNVVTNPEDYLRTQKSTSNKIRKLLQQVYDFTATNDQKNKNNPNILAQLVVNDLDAEQVWQLIELRNNIVWPQFLEGTSKVLARNKNDLQLKYKSPSKIIDKNDYESEAEKAESSDDYADLYDDDDLDGEDSEMCGDDKTARTNKKKEKSSVVDDKFFKLSEMEAFLKAEDEKQMHKKKIQRPKDDFDINMFEEDVEKDEVENVCYKDFFNDEEVVDDEDEDDGEDDENVDDDDDEDGSEEENEDEDKNENEFRNEEDEDDEDQDESMDEHSSGEENYSNKTTHLKPKSVSYEDSEELNDEEPKSSFENRQERLGQRIKHHEQDILGEKPWQLKGEINATNRPQNSLLEEFLQFEATTRPAPIITEETTLRLEDIIRQRIKDQIWDDVEFKVKPKERPQEYRKQLVLDQEKSKESLAHTYEKQYQQELEKIDPTSSESNAEESKTHIEIKELMTSLFIKLDALSNFHFIPKPVIPEPKILTNTPVINMEEVAPIAASSAKFLTPEEIVKRSKKDVLGINERQKTDKNRERRHKKLRQKAIQKVIKEKSIQKQNKGTRLDKKEEIASTTNELIKRRNVEKMSTSQADEGPTKSSKAFFSKLHETATMQKKVRSSSEKLEKNTLSAKKLKL